MVETINIGPMEIFLMTAISRGELNTKYALLQLAGLQPGNVDGVRKRLEAGGLLTISNESKRGRRVMTLTELGKQVLVAQWRNALDPGLEVESVLRGVTVAHWLNELAEGIRFLDDAISKRARRQGPARPTPASSQYGPKEQLLAEMRAVYETRRRQMEGQLLTDFRDDLFQRQDLQRELQTKP